MRLYSPTVTICPSINLFVTFVNICSHNLCIRQFKKTYPMLCYVNRKCVKGSTIYFSAGEVGAGRGSGVEYVCVGVCVCV